MGTAEESRSRWLTSLVQGGWRASGSDVRELLFVAVIRKGIRRLRLSLFANPLVLLPIKNLAILATVPDLLAPLTQIQHLAFRRFMLLITAPVVAEDRRLRVVHSPHKFRGICETVYPVPRNWAAIRTLFAVRIRASGRPAGEEGRRRHERRALEEDVAFGVFESEVWHQHDEGGEVFDGWVGEEGADEDVELGEAGEDVGANCGMCFVVFLEPFCFGPVVFAKLFPVF